jgi:flavin reductase (DIM6/NTAB) family NADH-FMN oxidoreductase RutF
MPSFNEQHFQELDISFRKNLINSLMGARPAVLIATANAHGKTNLAVFSQIVHVGANPPLCGILFRPDSVERHTLTNIRETGWFSLNLLSSEYAENVHQTSARYGADSSEFEAVGLDPEFTNDYLAPTVKQAHIKAICQLKEEIPVVSNGTLLVIGAIKWIGIEDECLRSDGSVNHYSGKSLAVCGLDDYASLQHVARFSYAKPDRKPEKLKP